MDTHRTLGEAKTVFDSIARTAGAVDRNALLNAVGRRIIELQPARTTKTVLGQALQTRTPFEGLVKVAVSNTTYATWIAHSPNETNFGAVYEVTPRGEALRSAPDEAQIAVQALGSMFAELRANPYLADDATSLDASKLLILQ